MKTIDVARYIDSNSKTINFESFTYRLQDVWIWITTDEETSQVLCKYTNGKGVLFTDEQIGIKKADELYSLKKKWRIWNGTNTLKYTKITKWCNISLLSLHTLPFSTRHLIEFPLSYWLSIEVWWNKTMITLQLLKIIIGCIYF